MLSYMSFQTRFNTGCQNYERSVIGFRGSLYELHADGGNLVSIHEFHENTNLAAAENRENISTIIVPDHCRRNFLNISIFKNT